MADHGQVFGVPKHIVSSTGGCGYGLGKGRVPRCISRNYRVWIIIIEPFHFQFCGKNMSLFVAYMDLEKVYDRIDRDAMWRVLSMYGINGKLLKVVQSLYERSEVCVRVCREEGEWFRVGVGLQQGV